MKRRSASISHRVIGYTQSTPPRGRHSRAAALQERAPPGSAAGAGEERTEEDVDPGVDHQRVPVLRRGLANPPIDSDGFAWIPEDDFVGHFAADIDPVKANPVAENAR
jgi:hypothetical protein